MYLKNKAFSSETNLLFSVKLLNTKAPQTSTFTTVVLHSRSAHLNDLLFQTRGNKRPERQIQRPRWASAASYHHSVWGAGVRHKGHNAPIHAQYSMPIMKRGCILARPPAGRKGGSNRSFKNCKREQTAALVSSRLFLVKRDRRNSGTSGPGAALPDRRRVSGFRV